MDPRLEYLLDGIASRFRRLRLAWILSGVWLSLAALVGWMSYSGNLPGGEPRTWSRWLPAGGLLVFTAAWLVSRSMFRDRRWLAAQIERCYPNLKQRLVTAIGIDTRQPMGYLRKSLLDETVKHSRIHDWYRTVPGAAMLLAWLSQFVSLGLCITACWWMLSAIRDRPYGASDLRRAMQMPRGLVIEPGHAEIERGTNLIVTARFDQNIPAVVWLDATGDSGKNSRQEMSKNLKDPVFGGYLYQVTEDSFYRVETDRFQSEPFRVRVFDYPALTRSDADIQSPAYSHIEPRVIEDTRRVTVVEGAQLRWICHVNKPMASAQLVDEQGEVTELVADPDNPLIYRYTFEMNESKRWKLKLQDGEGRSSKVEDELSAKVLMNGPPETKLAKATDLSVSPLQEVQLRVAATDDFAIQRIGLTYSLGGREQVEEILASGDQVGKKKEVESLIEFEKLGAEPDQLFSYFFWVEDLDRNGEIRRVDGDMFFAEVRPFEEIFREGQSMSQEQMQQMQQQQSQGAQQAEQLAELQKQIISGTWNIIRREKPKKLTKNYSEDVQVLADAQRDAMTKAEEARANLQDAQSLQYLETVTQAMTSAAERLDLASSSQETIRLREALTFEQSAYEGLLKLRAREHQIVRSRQQNQNQRGGGGAQQNRQQQIEQIELKNEEDRYETERQAQSEEDQGDREMRQVMNRLDELARRQKDINQQLKDIETAIQAAKDEQEKKELEEQLKRLRENQEELLRDSDELLERMNEARNQEAMEEARQQMEEAREQLRQSSEALSQNQTSPALSSGTRAQRQMDETREQLRQQSSNQFEDAMRDMLQEVRQLEDRQLELNQKLGPQAGQPPQDASKGEDSSSQNQDQEAERVGGLRPEGESQASDDPKLDWKKQSEDLKDLLNDMQETVTEAESSEPVLADRLYDSFRETKQRGIDQRLEQIPMMLDRGLEMPARQAAEESTQGITRLREQIEQAAEGVLGSESESLRRALSELERAKDQIQQELERRGGQTASPGQPPSDSNPSANSPQNQSNSSQDRQSQDPSQADPSQSSQASPPSQEAQQPGNSRSGEQTDQQSGQPTGQDATGDTTSPNRSNRPNSDRNGNRNGNPDSPNAGNNNPSDPQSGLINRVTDPGNRAAPLTGDEFIGWSDALREIEEMLRDPEMRAEAARIREAARDMRIDYKRHSKEPQWELVRQLIARPLEQLRQQVEQELLRQSAEKNAIVPVDRDPVPTVYQRQLQKYYENIGSN